MSLEPVKVQSNPILQSSTNRSGYDSGISKQQSLTDIKSYKAGRPPESKDKDSEEEKKGRDSIELSSQARQLLQTPEITSSENNSSSLNIAYLENSAVEFRGLQQVAKTRELTPKENDKLGQIKDTFAQAGIDENGINRIAEKKLQQVQQEAPQLISQFESGNVNANLFVKLAQVNESLNKANGFGITEQDFKAPVEEVAKVKSDFNSLVEVTKDRQLSRENLADLEQLTRQLSTIQGFQINIRNSIGQDGVLV